MGIFLYAGPTLQRALPIEPSVATWLRDEDITLRPPVQRGDLPRLRRDVAPPACLVLVDGLFHGALAVGHAEIRDALAAGFSVWGLSSRGANRAREMNHMGMRGFGDVYRLFCRPDQDFRDDEVALLHEPDPPYRELSEPLVHLRSLVARAVATGVVDEAAGQAVIASLAERWFGDRTLALTGRLLKQRSAGGDVDGLLADIDRHRVKAHDLIRFLAERPWLTA